MAHRSKKKHLKHLHEHEPVTPPAKSPVAKANVERTRAGQEPEPRRKRPGIVRRTARKLTARPKKIVSRAKARVKRILGD